MDEEALRCLAALKDIRLTWTDTTLVDEARQRLAAVAENDKQVKKPAHDFEFIVNDDHTYYQTTDFRSPQAKALFDQYRQLEQSFRQQREQLDKARQAYADADRTEQARMAPAILDLEKHVQPEKQSRPPKPSAKPNWKLSESTNPLYAKHMDIAIIAVLLIAAVILFLVELFVIPGISIAGILAGGCYLFANYYAFTRPWRVWGRSYGSCAPRRWTAFRSKPTSLAR